MEADKIRRLALARLGECTLIERASPCGGRTDSPNFRGAESSFGESVLAEAERLIRKALESKKHRRQPFTSYRSFIRSHYRGD